MLLPRIAGHRDGDMTDCPGNELYGRLPAVRTNVNRQAGPLYALSWPRRRRRSPPATPVTLSGSFTRDRAAGRARSAGAPLQLQSVAAVGVAHHAGDRHHRRRRSLDGDR